jgi:sugar-specific transcriptional regulator TrmB
LIILGKASAADVSKHSKVPYGRIYTVLDSLEAKSLIRLIPEEIKKYQPTDPEELEKYLTEKKNQLDRIHEKLKTYKTIYSEHVADAVQVAFGRRNFHKLSDQMRLAQKYSYSIKYTFELHPAFVREIHGYKKRKIDYKVIGRFDEETKENVSEWQKIHEIIKPIENSGVAISMVDDNEMLIGMIKSNTTLLIKDQSFIKLLKELFISYYETHDEKGNKINWKK